ncbi:polyprenyl synthetase family protein [Arthrobacter sp. H14-L1]|uniref:polyprenyl synthetase family protein n=1 Tax=Arthrobacter sp. H14-L1 TaxID=2996697 RepID=UPI00226D762A|nr:polyprenyl synthetase family protein [Arthrobacter sp. H14-L1]MCY0904227.1 polyprenyl synthetase family protein [Arthrobacter sp. H14-L1]
MSANSSRGDELPVNPGTANVRTEQDVFIASVARELAVFLDSKREMLTAISPDTLVLLDSIRTLVTGGKRLRALMCYWGWRGAGGGEESSEIIAAGVALELFQAAALIHDDIIDRSDIRRGGPSVHRRFSLLHAANRWSLDAERFGQAAAILTGDLCLSFSEEAFAAIVQPTAAGARARKVFDLMRTEVMAGQYLDILEEVSGPARPAETAVQRAQAIIRYKSAKYSTEHPLVLGGALAGAEEELLTGYSEFALPLGEAFQLRDDLLGVFGDPATTGKPAGDDLREGKRTVLVGLTLAAAGEPEARFVDERLGSQELGNAEIERIRAIIVDSGSLAAAETLIEDYSATAFAALDSLEIPLGAAASLRALATAAVRRKS